MRGPRWLLDAMSRAHGDGACAVVFVLQRFDGLFLAGSVTAPAFLAACRLVTEWSYFFCCSFVVLQRRSFARLAVPARHGRFA